MKKTLLLAVVALVFVCVGCNKTTNCKCTTTQEWQGIMEPSVTETTGTIEKGECSDMNATQTMNAGGDTYVATTECVEI